MRRKIVTTLGPGGWELYGKRFADSFEKYWPADITLEIWCHHLDAPPSHPRAQFYCLDSLPSFQKITQRLGPNAKDGPSLGFAFKAVALANAVSPELDWLAFIDADTETMRPITDELLDRLFDERYDLTYLWRKAVAESEGSWFAFNVKTKEGAGLLADYYGLYASGQAYKLQKPHDNAVLDHIAMIHQAHGLRVGNLSNGALGLDAFHQSPLGAYMLHYKGPNKDTIANPGIGVPSRYETVCKVAVHAYQQTGRADLVEVGTWNGSRAVHLAESLFAAGATNVSYVGFDTFESGNDRAHEGDTKPDASHEFVRCRLDNYRTLCKRLGREFSFDLIQGNTLVTLPVYGELKCKNPSFAYIDGGHSYSTTLSDYNNLSHTPYIVFDDLIAEPEDGAPEGPREVVRKHVKGHKTIWNSGDYYAGLKQTICLGIVTAPGYKPYELKQALQVKPVDSVDKSDQAGYIAQNAKAMPEWLTSYQAHTRRAILVSAGPTLPQHLDEIRAKQAAGGVVFAVKHALPTLAGGGIKPDYIVILDPRPADGQSTHGIMRRDLFASVQPGDKVLFATMTHPSVRELLEGKQARLIGWHAMTDALKLANSADTAKGLKVGGGTCSATRMPTLAFVMGFRRMDFYGYDFFYAPGVAQQDIKQKLMTVELGNPSKKFLTTGELVAAMQDLGVWAKWMVENNLDIQFFGEGAGTHIWSSVAPNYKPPAEYTN